VKLLSQRRYRATAAQKRMYGGSTTTVFLVCHTDDAKNWFYVEAFGKTPGDRKTVAKKRAEELVASGEFSKHLHESCAARATPPVSGGFLHERIKS